MSLIFGFWGHFPQIALIPQIPSSRYNLNLRWPLSFPDTFLDVKCGVENFVILAMWKLMIQGILFEFLQITLIPTLKQV